MREAQTVNVGFYPNHGNLDQWKVMICKEVQSASGQHSYAPFRWISDAFQDECSFDDLGDVPMKFRCLDQKMAASLLNSIPKCNLKDKITAEERKRTTDGKLRLPLAGVQIVRMIVDSFRYTRSLSAHYSHRDIGKMTWLGDGHAQQYLDELETLFRDLDYKDDAKRDLVLEHTDFTQDAERKSSLCVYRALAPSGSESADPRF